MFRSTYANAHRAHQQNTEADFLDARQYLCCYLNTCIELYAYVECTATLNTENELFQAAHGIKSITSEAFLGICKPKLTCS